jgi:hypothetical protein
MVSVFCPPFYGFINNQVEVIVPNMFRTDVLFTGSFVILALHYAEEVAID